MSARSIRKLQGNNVLAHLAAVGDDDDDDDDSSSDDDRKKVPFAKEPKAASAFALMNQEDDDDDSSSSSSEEEEEEEAQEQDTKQPDNNIISSKEAAPDLLLEEEEKEEDLDDILNEFKEMDHRDGSADSSSGNDINKQKSNAAVKNSSFPSLLLQDLDVRDLDMEYTMRNALLQDPLDNGQQQQQQQRINKKAGNSRTTSFLFGSPRDDWKQHRPPNFIGGGMGMIPYNDDNSSNNTAAGAAFPSSNKTLQPPWPYPQNNDTTDARYGYYCCWYTFRHGDAIQRDVHDYQQLIVHQGAGNVNALLLFVAHHPYIPSALLQLSTVLYQTNHNVEALSMLKRCLYIYECARLYKFTKHIGDDSSSCSSGTTMALLDFSLPQNAPFFEALVQLMRVCTNAGLYKSTFALSRYILSLDPLRDPMGMLLVLDSFALHQVIGSTNPAVSLLKWCIALCENSSKDLKIWYRDPDDLNSSYSCELLHMPNWAYSYAVALYQRSLLVMDDTDEAGNDDAVESPLSPAWKDRADKALQQAMHAHPTVVGQLLLACEVDTTGRSFQRDWPTVLSQATDAAQRLVQAQFSKCATADETIVVTATLQAVDKVISIYAKVAAKTWCQGGGNNDNERRNDLFQWLHDNLVEAMQEEERIVNVKQPPSSADKIIKDDDNANKNNNNDVNKEPSTAATAAAPPPPPLPSQLHPALMRYAKFQLSDFISNVAVLQLPGDVMNAQDNIIDPGMLAHAMVIDPRRPRFRRFMDRERGGGGMGGRGHDFDDGDDDLFAELQQQQRLFQHFGGPPRGIVDPDWPALEVFWRSFLPWNHVDGVAPPPPPPPGAL
jgi:Transcriptional repressor TCF25